MISIIQEGLLHKFSTSLVNLLKRRAVPKKQESSAEKYLKFSRLYRPDSDMKNIGAVSSKDLIK